MDKQIYEESRLLSHYNLNFTLDNLQVTIHNFAAESYDAASGYDTHQHSCYELHYVQEGQGHVAFTDQSFELNPGDLFLLSPYTPHKQIVYNAGMLIYTLRFGIQRLAPHTDTPTTDDESLQLTELLEVSGNQLFDEQEQVAPMFESAFTEAHLKKPGYYITLKQRIMDIIIHAARVSSDEDCPKPTYSLPAQSPETAQMEQITEYIQNNISEHICNENIAHHVHISDRQLHRIIKKQVGLSPHQYVTLLRINYVKDLMHSGSYTLRAISEMAGFCSEFHLSSAFKKFVHMTPREYLKKMADSFQLSEDIW